ncbi:MAG: thioesterase family protein [Flexilinea sp.]|nr:thioesterase family protein [Flexilinea sp.]
MKTLTIGTRTTDEYIVTQKDTARTFDSGGLDILATPMLICSAERSCKNMVDPLLEEGLGTVGTMVNIRHLAPTPVGMKYWCESEITAIEGRMIRFHVTLRDEIEIIGEGTHERFVINNERFSNKANRKLGHVTDFSEESMEKLTALMRQQLRTAIGRKALEFGSGKCSLAETLIGDLEYLACTDKSDKTLKAIQQQPDKNEITLIPDSELGEDCYFGRFHMVYTLFGFHDLPHLVDEIMRLRRLILKGGKMVVIDFAADGFADECIKQLKRCGFENITEETFDIDGNPAFLLEAVK